MARLLHDVLIRSSGGELQGSFSPADSGFNDFGLDTGPVFHGISDGWHTTPLSERRRNNFADDVTLRRR
jgi:hypothetical protein